MTAKRKPEPEAAAWQPAKPIKVRVRSEVVARNATEIVNDLIADSAKKKETTKVCRVPATVKALLTYDRLAFVQALANPAVDQFVLATFGQDHAYDLVPGGAADGFDIGRHRRQVCPCFRNPADGPPPDRLDVIEDRLDDLDDARDALWTEIVRMRTGFVTAFVGLRLAATPYDEQQEDAVGPDDERP